MWHTVIDDIKSLNDVIDLTNSIHIHRWLNCIKGVNSFNGLVELIGVINLLSLLEFLKHIKSGNDSMHFIYVLVWFKLITVVSFTKHISGVKFSKYCQLAAPHGSTISYPEPNFSTFNTYNILNTCTWFN